MCLQLSSYGTGSDSAGTCSYGANFADTVNLDWSTGTELTVAMNDDQFDGGLACGLCVMFRGTGTGIGTDPVSTDKWQFALVTNR